MLPTPSHTVILAGHALDTPGTQTLNGGELWRPAPKVRENQWVPGAGYRALEPAGPDARTVDLRVLIDGDYDRAGAPNPDPAAGAQATLDWLEENVYRAPETAGSVACSVTVAGSTKSGRVQIDDMFQESGGDGSVRVVVFEIVLPDGELT